MILINNRPIPPRHETETQKDYAMRLRRENAYSAGSINTALQEDGKKRRALSFRQEIERACTLDELKATLIKYLC